MSIHWNQVDLVVFDVAPEQQRGDGVGDRTGADRDLIQTARAGWEDVWSDVLSGPAWTPEEKCPDRRFVDPDIFVICEP